MPLVVLSRVYTIYLSTFGDDYMYELQKPLPLAELYSPRRNEGLISLLKYGLWQVSISSICHWSATPKPMHADNMRVLIYETARNPSIRRQASLAASEELPECEMQSFLNPLWSAP